VNYDRVTILCFAASYTLAFVLELLQQRWPNVVFRVGRLVAAGAGIAAHAIYLFTHASPLRGNAIVLLVLSLILAVFYVVGAIRHARQAWGLFVLPVVMLLVTFTYLSTSRADLDAEGVVTATQWLTVLHVAMLILGEVGLCVSCIASVMYLVQQKQLKADIAPTHRLPLLSLERLEAMQRHGLDAAFPLLSVGLLVGVALMFVTPIELAWYDPKVIATALLWLTVGVLVWLRHGAGIRGRRVAWGALLAFVLMLGAFAVSWFGRSAHPTATYPKGAAIEGMSMLAWTRSQA